MMEAQKITDHAVDRYIERVKPLLTKELARREIEALLATQGGEINPQAPSWIPFESRAERDFTGWIELSDGIALAFMANRAVSVFVRSGVSPTYRAHRRAAKKRKRRHSQAQKQRERNDRKYRLTKRPNHGGLEDYA